MVKITITDGEVTNEMEGKAVMAFIVQPERGSEHPDTGSMLMGSGKPLDILKYSTTCLGSVLSYLIQDETEKLVVSGLMVSWFRDAVLGNDMRVDIQENTVKKSDQEE